MKIRLLRNQKHMWWFLNVQNMGAGSMQVLLQKYFPGSSVVLIHNYL